MTTINTTTDDLALRLKETEQENELLLLQLHQAQEELEQYFLRNQELEKSGRSTSSLVQTTPWIDDELPNALAEVLRLQTLVEVQSKVHQFEVENSLNARLGKLLIQSVETPGGLLALPTKLIKIWRQSSQEQPPAELGGKEFGNVIAAYSKNGFDAVEQLLASVATSSTMQANAYTVLARHLRKSNRVQAAEAARRAHALDPRAYRLKWLAFRLHEAGEILEAEAMLDLLPKDTPYSDSEVRHVDQVRYEAKNYRARDAKQTCSFSKRCSEQEQQLKTLTQARDEQALLAVERGQEVVTLKQVKAQLEEEKAALAGRHNEQSQLAAERGQVLEALKQTLAQLEEEKVALVGRYEEQALLAVERGQEVVTLKRVKAQLEEEKSSLELALDEQSNLALQRAEQVDDLSEKLKSEQNNAKEMSLRQSLLEEELVRAEAQIDLIKEMLIREPGL